MSLRICAPACAARLYTVFRASRTWLAVYPSVLRRAAASCAARLYAWTNAVAIAFTANPRAWRTVAAARAVSANPVLRRPAICETVYDASFMSCAATWGGEIPPAHRFATSVLIAVEVVPMRFAKTEGVMPALDNVL